MVPLMDELVKQPRVFETMHEVVNELPHKYTGHEGASGIDKGHMITIPSYVWAGGHEPKQ